MRLAGKGLLGEVGLNFSMTGDNLYLEVLASGVDPEKPVHLGTPGVSTGMRFGIKSQKILHGVWVAVRLCCLGLHFSTWCSFARGQKWCGEVAESGVCWSV